MSKQMIFALLQLLVLPSLCLASCSDVEISSVNVTYGLVEWEANYTSSCLKGFEVCWVSEMSTIKYCEMTHVNQTRLTLMGVKPCSNLNVTVTAVGADGFTNVSTTAHGDAGLPTISGLKTVMTNRNRVSLTWSSLAHYTCVSSLNLWICNETQARNSCMHKEMQRWLTSIELYDYDFPSCQYFSADMDSADSLTESSLSGTVFYIGSNNKLTNATVLNVTSSTAVIEYELSIVDENCMTDILKVCSRPTSGATTSCYNMALVQEGSTRNYTLKYLDACTSYSAELQLTNTESYSPSQQVTFTTKRGVSRILRYVTATTPGYNSGVRVDWATNPTITPCVRIFKLVWTTTATNYSSLTEIPADVRTFYISPSYTSQTYYFELQAYFNDGEHESGYAQVYFPGPISSSNRVTITVSLLVSSLITILFIFGTI